MGPALLRSRPARMLALAGLILARPGAAFSWFGMFAPKSHAFADQSLRLEKELEALRVECFLHKMKVPPDLEAYAFRYRNFDDSLGHAAIPAPDRRYLQAAAEFDLFSIYFDWYPNIAKRKRSQDALDMLAKAQARLDSNLAGKIENARILELRGEINLRKIAFAGLAGGGFAAIELSNKGKDYLDRALRYDGKNARAYLGLGTWYLFAPSIAGGSPSAALKLFRTASELGGDHVKFMARIWSAVAYYNLLKDGAKASRELEQALVLAPGNPWILDMQEKVRAERPSLP